MQLGGEDMEDVFGAKLRNGDIVAILSNKQNEGQYKDNYIILPGDRYGIVIGEKEIFAKQYYNGKENGYKVINENKVIKVLDCNDRYKELFEELKRVYMLQMQMSISVHLNPCDVFEELHTKEKYIYLGKLFIERQEKGYSGKDDIQGDICIKLKTLVNRYNITVKNKNLYNMEYDLIKFYEYIFSMHNQSFYLDRDMFDMNDSGIYVGRKLGHLNIKNVTGEITVECLNAWNGKATIFIKSEKLE